MFGGNNRRFLSDNDIRKKKKRGYISPFPPCLIFCFFIVAFRCICLKNNKKENDIHYPNVALVT